MTKKLTLKQIQKLLAKWKKILRLEDWDISILMEPLHNTGITNLKAESEIEHWIQRKEAIIRIRPIEDRVALGMTGPFDMEFDIIHELLHLHFKNLTSETGDDEEIVINIISKILLTLRGNNESR